MGERTNVVLPSDMSRLQEQQHRSSTVVVKECITALRRLRNGEVIDERSPYARVLLAVERCRRDLRRRPERGGVYGKMYKELESKHVILWRVPMEQRPLPVLPRHVRPVPGLFRVAPHQERPLQPYFPAPRGTEKFLKSTARTAAMARSRTRVYVPRFLVALLRLDDCAATRMYLKRPELFAFFEDFLIMPNPAYYDGVFEQDPKRAASMACASKGFGLVAWWIHPELRKRSRFFSCHSDLRLPSRFADDAGISDASADRGFAGIAVADVLDCAADAVDYFYDVSDLESRHASAMARLHDFVHNHLATVYGLFNVNPDDIYFHRQHSMWSAPDRAWAMTLHLHISLSRARTPACYCHSISLQDVVSHLRRGDLEKDDASVELLNVPDDSNDFNKVASGLRDSGFLVSRPFSPADLSFDDLLRYTP